MQLNKELDGDMRDHSVIKKYLITAADGKNITQNTIIYRQSSPLVLWSTTTKLSVYEYGGLGQKVGWIFGIQR